MGSTQELSCARAELAAWKETEPDHSSVLYESERYRKHFCVLSDEGRTLAIGSGSTEAEAIEAALKAARGRG